MGPEAASVQEARLAPIPAAPRAGLKAVVCLPTRNEARSIAQMIADVRAAGFEVFIVDQSSNDGTLAMASARGVPAYQREGSGKGFGVRKALEVAAVMGAEVLVLIDCDCTYMPDDIPAVLAALGSRATSIGCRPMQQVAWPNRLVNFIHTGAVNLLFGTRLQDINSGLRALRVSTYVGRLDAAGFDIEAQMTILGVRSGLGVAEVPIRYRKRVGDSKVRAWDAARILWRIAAERFRPKRGGGET